MLSVKRAVYQAPAVADRVANWMNDGDLAHYVVVENLDPTSSCPIRYQESDDGATWVDIAGTTKTINPGESDGQIVTASRARIALHAGGNLSIAVSLARQVDGAPVNLGSA